MTERKQLARQLAKVANEKPKTFNKLLQDSFVGEARAIAGAKVLLYSRLIVIDKIAECLGGKDEFSIAVLNEYLNRQDYSSRSIEQRLRSFL